MEHIYSNPLANLRANQILSRIELVARPMSSPAFSMGSLNNTGLRIAEDLINSCADDLKGLKQIVGSNEETYLEISSALAVTASGIIKMPVSAISLMANTQGFHSDTQALARSKADLAEATKLMSIISGFNLNARARDTINQNMGILNVAEQRVNKIGSGCYIATSVYGDYNSHPVLVLRSFRDNFLLTNSSGRFFTKIYYIISPRMVKYFEGNFFFRKISKVMLDTVVALLK